MVTWLLDLDGVVLADKPKWHAAPRTKWVYSEGDSFKVRWAPRLVDEINAFAKKHRVIYASSWIPWIFSIRHATGLGNFDCIEWPNERVTSFERSFALKYKAALEIDDYLIWTDDDVIPPIGPERQILEDRGALLIKPDERYGLTPEDMNSIKDYATKFTDQ